MFKSLIILCQKTPDCQIKRYLTDFELVSGEEDDECVAGIVVVSSVGVTSEEGHVIEDV